MKLSRKWLNEFVDLPLSEIDDRAFDEAMTVSGSKVELTEDLSAKMKNVRVGRILSLEKHPNSDHMLVAQLDVGEAEPVQICTGAWNVHVGDLVPAALHNAVLPNGTKITKGKLRGVLSNGMLCSLKELDVTEHDFPYAVIEAAAKTYSVVFCVSDAAVQPARARARARKTRHAFFIVLHLR